MKVCPKCKRVLAPENFCKDKNRADGLDTWCKDCRKEYRQANRIKIKERHLRIRKENREYLNNNKCKCLKCGEDRPYLIQYHHVDPSEKDFTIGTIGTYSKEHFDREIEKCVCLCANCHIEFHYLYGQNPENPRESLDEYIRKT